jgi:hypothetical protein
MNLDSLLPFSNSSQNTTDDDNNNNNSNLINNRTFITVIIISASAFAGILLLFFIILLSLFCYNRKSRKEKYDGFNTFTYNRVNVNSKKVGENKWEIYDSLINT